jgi:hypothetical protein
MIRSDPIWYDTLCYDLILCDMIWYNLVRYEMIWYDLIRYDIWYDLIRYDIWYDLIRYDIWYDLIRYDIVRSDSIWYMIRSDPIYYPNRYDIWSDRYPEVWRQHFIRNRNTLLEISQDSNPQNVAEDKYRSQWPRVYLRPLACSDRWFETQRGHGYLSVASVVCCQVEVSETSWSLIQRSPTDCDASLCVI